MFANFFKHHGLWTTAAVSCTLTSGLRFSITNVTTSNQTNHLKPGPNLLLHPVTPKVVTYPITDDKDPYHINDEHKYGLLPPIAKQRATYTYLPWDTLVDYYAYLRDRESPETLSYLDAENVYTEYRMKHTSDIQHKLYGEMLTRIVEDDSTVPAKNGPYLYYSRTEAGKPYNIYCRKLISDNKEQIILDVNELAKDKEFLKLGSYEISTDHKILAYTIDDEGKEYFDLYFKNLETGEMLEDCIKNISVNVAFCNDNKTLYYIKYNDSWRPYQLWRHTLGEPNDTLIYEEKDSKYRISISRSRSNDYMILHIGSAQTDEVWYKNANIPNTNNGKFTCIAEREQDIEYSAVHHSDANTNEFLILINENAINFELFSAKIHETFVDKKEDWTKIIEHDPDVTLQTISSFKDFIIIKQRNNGLSEYRIRHNGNEHVIDLPENSYAIWNADNFEYDTNEYRFLYTSLITPVTTYDYNVCDRKLITRKIRNTNEYNKENYQSFSLFATAIDGTKIPISCIARSDLDISSYLIDGEMEALPFYLIGYGSYGYPYDVYFSSNRLSLIDRGIIVGYAHIRGGGEFGRKWKLDGKLRKKMNTFHDYFACAEYISKIGLTNNSLLIAEGASAGGLLMGAVINMRPDLFHAIVADVPFVDIINTVLDEDIPLTSNEWEEWGDPRTMEDYFYIKSYSPYDNICGQQIPNLLVNSGLNDNRVQYWEPTKFVAKLRHYQMLYQHLYPDEEKDNTILLKTEMSCGHSGASGRYGRLKEIAFAYAFILDQFKLMDVDNLFVNIDKEKVERSLEN